MGAGDDAAPVWEDDDIEEAQEEGDPASGWISEAAPVTLLLVRFVLQTEREEEEEEKKKKSNRKSKQIISYEEFTKFSH